MSAFGITTGDLAELWKSQPTYTYQSHAQGWECPKCGRVYSPSMVMCSYCVPPKLVTTTTTDTVADPKTAGTFTGPISGVEAT